MTRSPGFSVAEALVGTALAGIALAALSAVAGLGTRGLALARDTTVAVALASERLEALRTGPRRDGNDTVRAPHGTVFARTWTTAGGRGRPARLAVRVTWERRAVEMGTEALP